MSSLKYGLTRFDVNSEAILYFEDIKILYTMLLNCNKRYNILLFYTIYNFSYGIEVWGGTNDIHLTNLKVTIRTLIKIILKKLAMSYQRTIYKKSLIFIKIKIC